MSGALTSQVRQPPASPALMCRCRTPPQYRSSSRISASALDRSGPGSGAGNSINLRRAGRARPSSSSATNRDFGMADIRATGRPRSVIVTVSPAAASATTADAFCLSARIPTSVMCFIVAHWTEWVNRNKWGTARPHRASPPLTRRALPSAPHVVGDLAQVIGADAATSSKHCCARCLPGWEIGGVLVW